MLCNFSNHIRIPNPKSYIQMILHVINRKEIVLSFVSHYFIPYCLKCLALSFPNTTGICRITYASLEIPGLRNTHKEINGLIKLCS